MGWRCVWLGTLGSQRPTFVFFCPDAEMGQRRRGDEEVGCGDGGLCAHAETSEDDWIDFVSVVRGPARPSVRSRRGW